MSPTPNPAGTMETTTNQLLQAPLHHLQEAVEDAQNYLREENTHAEIFTIHINFISQRIAAVDRAVQSINRRNKNDNCTLPNEAELANTLIKKLQIERALRERNERERAAAPVPPPPEQMQVIIKKPPLPPLQIPRFTGDTLEYHNFITIFDETVHKNESLVPSQKLAYLQSYVDGEAKKLIGKILVTDANYAVARETLKLNYGQTAHSITILYDRLHDIAPAKNDPFSIRDTYNEIETILQMIEHAGVQVNNDTYLYHEMMKKWPWSLIRQIVRSTEMDMKQFRQELAKEIQLQIQLTQTIGYTPYATIPVAKQRTTQLKPVKNTPYAGISTVEPPTNRIETPPIPAQRTAYCVFCQENHYSEYCTKYATLTQRLERITDRCKKCFRKKHDGNPCIRNMKCSYCPSYEHNRAICPVKYGEVDAVTLLTETHQEIGDPPGLFITLCTTIRNPKTGETVDARILIDFASNRTVMTEEIANKISLSPKTTHKKRAKGMGGKIIEPISVEAIETLIDVYEGDPIPISVHLTANIAPDLPTYNTQKFRQQNPQYQNYYIPPTGSGRPIDIILGSDTMLRFLTLQTSIYVHQTCQLLSTKFGWLIMAENEDQQETQPISFFVRATASEDIIQIMCDLDIVGMKSLAEPQTEMEERALKNFYNTVKFVQNRYEVHWPWKIYPPLLNENYGLAYGRLRSLFKQLLQKKELLTAYDKIIQEQLLEGVIEDIPADRKLWGKVVHYIPHHAVITLEKTTPIRIVYDGSATITPKRSLNHNILKGTKWLGNMVESLLRFRKNAIAISADIKRAFHQIAIAPEDRDAVRFLWVHDVQQPLHTSNIRIMRFRRVAFGIVASPFLLYATIQYHLQQNPNQFTPILATEMYADNLLVSLPRSIDPVNFYTVTKHLFSTMSMDLTKWKTNAKNLTQAIPLADRSEETDMTVLGLVWKVQNDKLALKKPKLEKLNKLTPTKRVVLQTMASIFDPLGWISPFLLFVRLYLRSLWTKKLTWDQPLQHEDASTWQKIKQEIEQVKEIYQDRMYFPFELDDSELQLEIHTFVDASAEAIGNVTYLRAEKKEHTYIAFVFAKSRLTPAIKLSIPRLELYGMAMGVRVQQYVVEALKLKCETKRYLWSDSKCVLAWIASNKLLPTAIEKHLKEIRNKNIHQFNYVPTANNPADVASRGTTLLELKRSQWLSGPDWLKLTTTWPQQTLSSTSTDLQMQEETEVYFIQNEETLHLPTPFDLNIVEFSELRKLLRRTAFCIRALNILLKKQIIKTRIPIDHNSARILWIKWDQKRNHAQNPNIIRTMSHLKNLQLFIDEQGITRCRSRLANANIPQQTINPIVLVKGSKLTELMILDAHERNFHVGTAHTLAVLRKHYWIPHGRRLVYHTIHTKCFKCRRHYAQPFSPQIPPSLPQFRVNQTSTPFENTGVDVFGPVYVYTTESGNKTKAKRWVLLLTCLVIRALHLEVLCAMDTSDIICALKRFTARRGTPKCLLSDNAPQFHLVQGCLTNLWTTFRQDEQANKYFAEHEIEWKFIPQSAPWMGGAYERLVQVTKNAFKKTYGEQTLTEREFNTTIVEIEGVINNRPLTYVDRELGTPLITPNHFLRVSYPAIPIDINKQQTEPATSTRTQLLQYWKAAENHMNIYWRCWSEHYLAALRDVQLRKTGTAQTHPVIGEIVLMVDPSQRRGYWRTAQIERLIPSADGKYRSAQIRVANGNRLIRPLVKLAPLNLLENLPIQQSAETLASSSGVEGPPADLQESAEQNAIIIAPKSTRVENTGN